MYPFDPDLSVLHPPYTFMSHESNDTALNQSDVRSLAVITQRVARSSKSSTTPMSGSAALPVCCSGSSTSTRSGKSLLFPCVFRKRIVAVEQMSKKTASICIIDACNRSAHHLSCPCLLLAA